MSPYFHIGIGIDTDNTRGYSTADPKVHWWTRLFGAPAGAPELNIPAHLLIPTIAPSEKTPAGETPKKKLQDAMDNALGPQRK